MTLASVDPYRPDQVRQQGGHAVVVGASIAGLLAARVLADAFERVTVLDRDQLDEESGPRRGVPQGRHTHVLLVAGQVVMEDLVPGLADDLLAAGALVIDVSREFSLHAADGFLGDGAGGIPMYFASRPLVERSLRARVSGHDRVVLRPGRQVVEPLASDDRDAVEGVVALEGGSPTPVHADLVVDASGRASRSSAWLEHLGYEAPSSETVEVDLAYRTCQVQRPTDDRRAMLVMPSPPRSRGATLNPVEGDRWFVTLFGMHGDHPPSDLDGLRDFAGALPTPAVREVLENHAPVTSETAQYRFPASTWRRYDQLADHPRGLVSVGDAVASFNPIYGQGMTVAALEALALHDVLADGGVEELASRFYRRSAGIIRDAWNMSAGGDFQFPQTTGDEPRGTGLVNRYVTRLHRKARSDGVLADAFARVVVMEEPPTSLFRPRLAWRVLRPPG